jgi:hypothetical protein
MDPHYNEYNAGEYERGGDRSAQFKETTIGFKDKLDLDKHKQHLESNQDNKPIGALPEKSDDNVNNKNIGGNILDNQNIQNKS